MEMMKKVSFNQILTTEIKMPMHFYLITQMDKVMPLWMETNKIMELIVPYNMSKQMN